MWRVPLWTVIMAIAFAAPPVAEAARVVSTGGQITYTAGINEPNALIVKTSGGQVVLEDANAGMSARSGCTQLTPRKASCAPGALTVLLGDRDDSVAVSGLPCAECVGGPGADAITGSDYGDELSGGDGADSLTGSRGVDDLRGMAGADGLDGGRGSDSIAGGADIDTVSYARRSAGVRITLDGLRNDGNADDGPARDLIRADIENATGGGAGDSITGSPGANRLSGAGGADDLEGADGDDLLDGGTGPDVLGGGSGVDTVSYETRQVGVEVTIDGLRNDGNDADGELRDSVPITVENVIGGRGDDFILGSGLDNRLEGGDGDDSVSGFGHRDVILGGEGADSVSGGGGEDNAGGGPGDDLVFGGDEPDPSVRGEEGDDMVDGGPGVDGIAGGPGKDTLFGGSGEGSDSLDGGDGNDVLSAAPGNDSLAGGPGDDELDGGPGADGFSGADGFDTVTYEQHKSAVTVSIDGVANDGNTIDLFGDNVHTDVESLITTNGDDVLDTLDGNAGAIDCRGGTDSLIKDAFDTDVGCETFSEAAALAERRR